MYDNDAYDDAVKDAKVRRKQRVYKCVKKIIKKDYKLQEHQTKALSKIKHVRSEKENMKH